ncbi:MAG: tRNA pseudouridine(55) synthase TruB [Pseudomonadota bacterium]
MGRRRKKGRPVNGWIVLDKDYDVGSTEAVGKVKWLFQAQKAGHAGTLDPLATGILPIALGEATKTAAHVTDARKTYRFTAKWGETTSTDDAEGEVIKRSDARPTSDAINDVLARFTGEIDQVPPQFSAVMVNGERAYDIAREGETVALPSRKISVYSLSLLDTPDADTAIFEAETGKGAYVRAIVRDMAVALGTCGHVTALRRTAVGPFREENAITIAELEAYEGPEAREDALAPIHEALLHMPQAPIGGPEADKLRRGQPAILSPAVARGVRAGESGFLSAVLAVENNAPVAICALDGLKLKPSRVFNLDTGNL